MVSPVKRSSHNGLNGHRETEESAHDAKIAGIWSQAIDSRQVLEELPTGYQDNYQDLELATTLAFFLEDDQTEKHAGGHEIGDHEAWGSESSSSSHARGIVLEERGHEDKDELSALAKKLKFQENVGNFLGKNPKFRVAYSIIVERLKNDLIGRATVASGYLKQSAFYEPPTGQSLAKKAAKVPLKFLKIGSVGTVTGVSGLIGGACGIAAVAASGISGGATLALEVIPIVLGVITPVVTTAIKIGEGIAERVSDEVHDLIFNQVNGKAAKNKARILGQVGSITHHDQLNMELAFGFVFLWQKQIAMLTEKDVVQFSSVWVDVYLKFIQKNKKALSDMIFGNSGFSFLLEDLAWDDIPKVNFTNIFNSGSWQKYWLGADAPLQERLSSRLSKNFTSRALIQKTGIRYRKGDQWHYWSDDPGLSSARSDKEYVALINDHRRTRAWLYGYRTFYSEGYAKTFIELHTNHYLTYDFAAIRLIVQALIQLPAHVSNRGGKRIHQKEGTFYIISSDHLNKRKQTLAVIPAVQRFAPSDGYTKKGEDRLLGYFESEVVQVDAAFDELVYKYLNLIVSGGLFSDLSHHQEQLEIQLTHLVDNKKDSGWEKLRLFIVGHESELKEIKDPELAKRVTNRLMEICLKARMRLDGLTSALSDLEHINQERRKSPIQELVENTEEEGRLLIPCTVENGHNWILYELIIKKSQGEVTDVTLVRRTVKGIPEPKTSKMERIERKIKRALKKHDTLKKAHFEVKPEFLTEVYQQALDEIRKTYPDGPISSGIFVAEYIRCHILGDTIASPLESKKAITEISREHRRLMRYYHRIGYKLPKIEHHQDLKGLIAEEEDIVWREETDPIGPPILERVDHKTMVQKIKSLFSS